MTHNDIQSFIEELLKKTDVAFESVTLEEIDDQTIFQIKTSESAKLIGSRGDTIKALNHIVRRAFEESDMRFTIDVNGYHTTKIESLKQTAKMLAERARSLKYNVEMTPMSAYDRMIVHSALSTEPHIVTESHGEGRDRRVVIRYVE